MNKLTKDYVSTIANKLAAAREEGMFDDTFKVRNDEGIMRSFSRLLETATQFFFEDPSGDKDPARAVVTFSAATEKAMGAPLGVSGAPQETLDAMDISIAAAVFSLIPYLAIERDMTASSTSFTYQDLIAEFAQGNVNAGEAVLGSFIAPNSKVNLSLPTKTITVDTTAESGASTQKAEFTTPIMPESLSIVVKTVSGQTETVVATGFDRGGKAYLSGSSNFPITVDYRNGVVDMTGVPNGLKVSLIANLDSSADSTGSSILTITPSYKTKVLTAVPQQLVYKDNQLKNAYLNKLNVKLAGTNAAIDYGSMAVGKLINIYIHYVNRMVVLETLAAGNATAAAYGTGNEIKADISAYTAQTSFADTKYDIIKNLIIALNQRSLDKTGRGITCILTSSRGVNKLAAAPDFVKSADFNELNAMVGTYDGIPVIRHQSVAGMEPSDGKTAYYYGIYKDPAGEAAPIAFGEFLPVTTSVPVANFNNPSQVAQSLTAYCGVVRVVDELCNRAELKFLP